MTEITVDFEDVVGNDIACARMVTVPRVGDDVWLVYEMPEIWRVVSVRHEVDMHLFSAKRPTCVVGRLGADERDVSKVPGAVGAIFLTMAVLVTFSAIFGLGDMLVNGASYPWLCLVSLPLLLLWITAAGFLCEGK